MDWPEIIAETVVATTLMSLFSYLISKSFRKLFTEPVLINYVIALFRIDIKPKMTSALGWILHYFVGLLFVLLYHWLWRNGIMDEDWSLWLGCASGIVGVLGWMIIFRLPRKEPRVAFVEYYVQLFFAHVIFAISASFVHQWLT